MGFLTRFIASGIQDDTARTEARAAHVKKVTAKCESLYVRSMRSIERASRREWCEDEDEDEDDRSRLRAVVYRSSRDDEGWMRMTVRDGNARATRALASRAPSASATTARARGMSRRRARPRGFSSSKTRQPKTDSPRAVSSNVAGRIIGTNPQRWISIG